ncbi:hypothetical protein BG000_007419 [Podila horticola]|nr:hypothetical protein BG000_007419 [Podila horticola]
MNATQVPHRGQRFYHIFLVALGVVLLGLSAKSVVDWEHLRRRSRVPLAGSDGAFLKYHASILVPNAAMILMYLVLVIGRPRLSNQKLHSILRVAFALALIAGLLQHTAETYREEVQAEKYFQELSQQNDWLASDYSFVKYQFCDKELYGEGQGLTRCQVEASRNVLYLISAVLMLVELVVGFRVSEIGKGKE